MRWKRWSTYGLLAAAVAAAIGWGLRRQPVLVDAVEVVRGLFRVTVEEEGKTRVKERFVVSAPITGQMGRVDFVEGARVRSGQRLTSIAPSPPPFLDPRTRSEGRAAIAAAESRIAAARERVHAAQTNADYWRAEFERVSRLTKSGDVPRSRYDQVAAESRRADAAVREAKAAVEAERAAMRRARTAIEQPSPRPSPDPARVPVVAPVSGRILQLIRDSAGPVAAGEPLLVIGDPRSIEVEVDLLTADAVKVAPGTRVLFTRWGGDQPIEGIVDRIEAAGRTKISALGVEEQRVPVIVDITSPPAQWAELGAGYRVEASFILWEAPDVLQIPSSAVFHYQGEPAVFLVEDGVARRRVVKLGRHGGFSVQVLGGLDPGERIVSHPDQSIEDGTPVQPR